MSEVKKYNAYAEGLTVHFELDSEGSWVTAEDSDAQRLRADTAEADQASTEEKRQTIASAYTQLLGALGCKDMAHSDALSRIAAAEQRIAELRELLRLMTVEYASCLEAGYDRIIFLGGDCDTVSKMLDDNVNYAKACAALNPKPEEESHDPDDIPPPGDGWEKPGVFKASDLDRYVQVDTGLGISSGKVIEFSWDKVEWWRFEQ